VGDRISKNETEIEIANIELEKRGRFLVFGKFESQNFDTVSRLTLSAV
jgi:hypothetical protein